MSPEFGSTCAIFPIDAETLRYLRFTGRPKELIDLVEAYAKEQGLWHDEDAEEPTYSDTVELDLGDGRAVARRPEAPAGPRRRCTGAKDALPRGARRALGEDADEEVAHGHDEAIAETFPPPTRRPNGAPGHRRTRTSRRRARGRGRRRSIAERSGLGGRRRARRRGVQARSRPRGHRRDHVVHEHLEPVGHARRRAAGAQRGRARAGRAAVGQDVAGARARRSSPSTSTAPA